MDEYRDIVLGFGESDEYRCGKQEKKMMKGSCNE
jgi:hypothetical protein